MSDEGRSDLRRRDGLCAFWGASGAERRPAAVHHVGLAKRAEGLEGEDLMYARAGMATAWSLAFAQTLLASLWGGVVTKAAPPPVPDVAAYVRDVEAWRGQRLARLKSEDGWLTLAGLFWLKPGQSTVGSAPDNDVVLPASAPARVGVLVREGGSVTFALAPNVAAELAGAPLARRQLLRSDAGEKVPDVVKVGPSVTLQIIDRAGRLGVRVKDAASSARASFKGLSWYPVDPAWRVKARFLPHDKPVTIHVPSVIGSTEAMVSPGTAEMVIGGKTYRLDAVQEAGERRLFFIFRDATAGRATYGAGRFLYAEPPRAGEVILDFNEAYSPPCAFTPYATCPLPPPQNRLPIPVPAGERYDGPAH